MPVAGLRGTGDWGTDQRPKDFRETILFRNPNGSAPITALMSKMSEDSVTDPEFNWWDEPNDIVRLQVNGQAASGDSVINVDSGDPSESDPGQVYGKATHLKPGDILQAEEDVADYSTVELLIVEEVISDTQIKVQRGASGSTAETIEDDSYLLKIGSAYGEGTSSPRSVSRNPVKYYNLCQIFKTPYELTRTAEKTKTRTGDPWKNDKKRKMFDHSRDMELAFLFGKRHETTDVNGKPLRFTGGLREFLPSQNVTIRSAAYNYMRDFLDDVYPVFDFDTEAGDERIVFGGNGALNTLNKMAENSGDVNFSEKIKVYGMTFRQFDMPQGTFYFKTHPLMNRNSLYTNSLFIIDASALRYRYMRDTHSQNDIQLPDEDTRKGQWFTEAGLEVRYGGLSCGYVGNLTFSAT